jgi:HlyD family secretion protein
VKRLLGVLFVGGLLALIVVFAMPRPVPVDVAPLARGAMRVTVDEDGRSRVKDRHVVSAPLTGSLARIELHPGDQVEAGQVLARILPLAAPLLDVRTRGEAEARVSAALAAQQQARAQVERAQAALEFAKTNAERTRLLNAGQVTTQQELERAMLGARTSQAELESARFGARVADSEVSMARAALGRLAGKGAKKDEQLEVPAPVAGRILRVMQESEGVVQMGAPVLEVGDPATLEVVVDVLTRDAVDIHPGARVTIDRWGGAPLEARVRLVEPSAFTRLSALGVEEQRVNVIIDIVAPRDQWKSLGDGYRVEAQIVVWEEPNVVKLPASAVFRHDGGWAVFRADGGVARLTSVGIGKRNAREVQILSGIAPPASVILYPSDRVSDNVKIRSRVLH